MAGNTKRPDKQETRGRKPLKDPGGEVIEKKVCNMTIPRNLYNYLKENNISRSKLFTEMAKDIFAGKINPCCFKDGVKETIHGTFCIHCSNPPYRHTWLDIKFCSCGHQFTIQSDRNMKHYGKVGCYRADCLRTEPMYNDIMDYKPSEKNDVL